MPRVSVDLDPILLTKLRAAANRREVTIDALVNEAVAAALRIKIGEPKTKPRPTVQSYDYDDVDVDDRESDNRDSNRVEANDQS